jgi:hypothetical protein
MKRKEDMIEEELDYLMEKVLKKIVGNFSHCGKYKDSFNRSLRRR